ncbi:MAG TPA: DUF885 domain-containing protein [Steroidobacteraceae bacterium]|nr:DUF885 domain-containing protein [Steroidobacteraceae bacterium]
MSRIVDRYWDERVAAGTAPSPQFLADSLAFERRLLDEVLALPPTRLDADSKLTYDIFKRQRELDIEGFTYPAELLPINPFDGMPQQFARMAADRGLNPLSSVEDYDNWLLRIDGHVLWTRQAIANMREGLRRGYTSPRILMERTLPMLQAFGADSAANVFYLPLQNMPETIKDSERTRLSASLDRAIKDKLLPAYRELHDFIQHEYLPRARSSVALSALPLGPSWYSYLVRRETGGLLTPNEIHGIGAAEVERIRARMQPRPMSVPADKAAGLSAYRELKEQTLAAMPALFSASPPADFEIRAFPPVLKAAPLLAYRPAAPDGRVPAILYVNAEPSRVSAAPGVPAAAGASTAAGFPPTVRVPGAAGFPPTVGVPAAGLPAAVVDVAGFLQQAIPGRHYQSALQQQRTDLPKFRRFGSEPAFVDGWALYAASLGEDLGLYRDDEAKRGAPLGQLKCAVALVVDTGLHAKGWTHAQAVDYLRAQLAVDDADANQMTDRFVALPAESMACKMGELRIRALRAHAQQMLGARFDIREFHSEILKDGAMPLDILEAKMKLWLEARR